MATLSSHYQGLAVFPPVLLRKAGSTFANEKIVSIQFQVHCRDVGTDPAHLVPSSVFLPGPFCQFQISILSPFPFFSLGLIAHLLNCSVFEISSFKRV